MGLLVEHSFEVKTPIDVAWAYFSNPPQVVPCIPGAELIEVVDERTYLGRAGIRVGQIGAQFKGEVQLQSVDPNGKRITMIAVGSQVGAVGQARAQVDFSLHEAAPGLTEVRIVGDVTIAGKLALTGGSMIQTVTKFIFESFSKCVVSKLETEEIIRAEPPPSVESSGLRGRITGAVRGLIAWIGGKVGITN